MKRLFALLLCTAGFTAFSQKQPFLLVGTYTGGQSKGIHVYRFNPKDGTAQLADSVVTENPSYLAVSPDQRFVYAVNEVGNTQGGGKVSAFQFDRSSGHLAAINDASSMGESPCYISIDRTGKWAAVGNYGSGTLTVLPIKSDGSLGSASTVIQHNGIGATARQKGPHVHATVFSPDNRYLYVPDLGKDKLMIYAFNQQSGTLSVKDSTLKLQAGSGPRHFVFHPNGKWAYLVQELSGTVTLFQNNNGNLTVVETVTLLPTGFNKPFSSADIHISADGNFLYTSTRDQLNAITIFHVDKATGKLTQRGVQPTLGRTPRNFNFDPGGNFLLVANQNSNQVVIFRVNHDTGELTDTGNRIDVGNPVCLKWVTR